ncbi:multidrug effflux MFS transporter [Sandaracinobacteroides hominis]|uniref:multidrug effflux MFS transporter n=1 Tax=Sandaracinobacteroides hominis TaxID=2780086 RepID=UPI0018F6E3FA|nr:multidrug effflux MFS transporter [Sandaracinobacteroides hominis]
MHAPAKPARPSVGLVILLGALTAFGAISIDLYLPALPTIARHFHAPVAAAQITMSAFLAGMALGQLVFGPLSDRIGRRIPLIAGALIYTFASLALALAPSIEMLAVGRFVQALGACAGVVIARAVVRDKFDTTESARLFSLMFLVLSVAPMLAPSLGALLLEISGWQSIFLVLSAFGLISAAAIWFGLPESRSVETALHAASESPLQSYRAALQNRRVLGTVLAGALNGAALFTYIGTSPALFMEYFGQNPHAFGWIFAVNAGGLVIASQINRYLLLRYTPARIAHFAVLAATFFAAVLLLLSILGLATMPVTIALLFLGLGSFGFVGGNTSALALGAMPIRAGAISALIGAASFAVGAVASAITAPFASNGPTAMAAGILAGFAGSAYSLIRIAGIHKWTS